MTQRSGTVRVGCSGWMYDAWRPVLYPDGTPKSQWLRRYADRFDTVEVNSTFYRLPAITTVERWAGQVPEQFVFAFKLGAFGSHRMKLRDAETWLPNHVERVKAAGRHLGPTVVQLPPRWRRDAARLDEFLAASSGSMRWAVELREPSWVDDEVFTVLARHGAALCVHDLLPDHPTLLTADWTYVRFHGPDALHQPYQGRYGRRGLERRAAWLSEVRDDGADIYAFFNNDVDGNAVADAATLHDLLAA